MHTNAIESLGHQFGLAALTALVRICPEVRSASNEQLEAACAAMRAKSTQVLDEFLADVQDTPWISKAAFQAAVLAVAQEGARTLRASN